MLLSMNDDKAKFYWPDPTDDALRDFVRKNHGRPLDHFNGQKLRAAIHIMNKRKIALNPESAKAAAAPAPQGPAAQVPGATPNGGTPNMANAAMSQPTVTKLPGAVQNIVHALQQPAGAPSAAPPPGATVPAPTPAPTMQTLSPAKTMAMVQALQKLVAGVPIAQVTTGDKDVDDAIVMMAAHVGVAVSPPPGTTPPGGPAAGAQPQPSAGPALRPMPPTMRPFDDASAQFYWPGTDDATLKAFLDAKATGPLSTFDERKYHAAVYLLKKSGAIAVPKVSAVGGAYVYEIQPSDPNIGGMRVVRIADAADVAAGHLSEGDHPQALETALENHGFYRAMEWVFEIDDGLSDAQAAQVLQSLGMRPGSLASLS